MAAAVFQSESGNTAQMVLFDEATGSPLPAGSIPFTDSDGQINSDPLLTWDDTNKALKLGEATNVALGTATGTKIGTSATQKLGFYNATPVVQRAGAAQTALTDSTGGTPSATLAAIVAGGTYAQADIVAIKNALSGIAVLVNEHRAALVALGLIKGAA